MPTAFASEIPSRTVISSAPSRIAAIDFTKGALVLFMVLYHWLSYFHGPYGIIYRYLRFLPPSFIFITGFLISNAYLVKYSVKDKRLPKRLATRGLKILSIFLSLNISIDLLFRGFSNLAADYLLAVFVSGNIYVSGSKAVAFYILVPISYLLLISSVLLIICRFYRYTFHAVFLLSLAGIAGLYLAGLQSANLELFTTGLLGLILGYIPIDKINSSISHPFALVFSYCFYVAVITLWEPDYVLQVAGVCLTLTLIYLLGSTDAEATGVRRGIILLGKYPLFGYIAQILVLQILRASLRFVDLGIGKLLLTLIAAVACTVMAVVIVDFARGKSLTMDRWYKAVFA